MSLSVLLKNTDLDEDKGQSVLHNMKTNIFKQRAEDAAQFEFLHQRLSTLENTKKKAEVRIMRGIKELKEQALYLQTEQTRVNDARAWKEKAKMESNVTLNLNYGRPISRRTPKYGSRNTPRSILKPVKVSFGNPKFSRYCKFEEKKSECKSFPCLPCSNYTNLGYFWTDDDDKTDVHSIPRGLSARSRSELWHRVETTSVLRPLRQPYNKCIKQEKSLQKIMDNMRKKMILISLRTGMYGMGNQLH